MEQELLSNSLNISLLYDEFVALKKKRDYQLKISHMIMSYSRKGLSFTSFTHGNSTEYNA